MSLIMDCTTPQGIQVNAAFCKVEAISLPSETASMTFALRRYAADEGVPFFQEEYFATPYDAQGADPFTQAYAYLRTLPEFASAQVSASQSTSGAA